MFSGTRSTRIRALVRRVLKRIPKGDRDSILGFVGALKCSTEWETEGLGGEIGLRAGGLFPLYYPDSNRIDSFIEFNLPICRLYSDRAMMGIIAHEFAHASRASQVTGDWHEKMQRRYNAEERHADEIARAWGFGSHIDTRHREHSVVVEPFVMSRRTQIYQQIARTNARRAEVRMRNLRRAQGTEND